jgi:hypothetical protein
MTNTSTQSPVIDNGVLAILPSIDFEHIADFKPLASFALANIDTSAHNAVSSGLGNSTDTVRQCFDHMLISLSGWTHASLLARSQENGCDWIEEFVRETNNDESDIFEETANAMLRWHEWDASTHAELDDIFTLFWGEPLTSVIAQISSEIRATAF